MILITRRIAIAIGRIIEPAFFCLIGFPVLSMAMISDESGFNMNFDVELLTLSLFSKFSERNECTISVNVAVLVMSLV